MKRAFGRLQGRPHVLVDSFLRESAFATGIALVCCALHNVCERSLCPFEDSWFPVEPMLLHGDNAEPGNGVGATRALLIRNALAEYASGIV